MRGQDNFFTYHFEGVFVQTTEGYASGIVGYQCGAGGHCRCDIWRQEGDQKKKNSETLFHQVARKIRLKRMTSTGRESSIGFLF